MGNYWKLHETPDAINMMSPILSYDLKSGKIYDP